MVGNVRCRTERQHTVLVWETKQKLEFEFLLKLIVYGVARLLYAYCMVSLHQTVFYAVDIAG